MTTKRISEIIRCSLLSIMGLISLILSTTTEGYVKYTFAILGVLIIILSIGKVIYTAYTDEEGEK